MNSQNIHLVGYGTFCFEEKGKLLIDKLNKTGWLKSIEINTKDSLDESFKTKYENILNRSRGDGYWLWKPEIIKRKLSQIPENDILIYADIGCEFNFTEKSKLNFDRYINLANEKSIIRFQMPHCEKVYTNKKTIDYFKQHYNLSEEDINSNQFQATVMIFKNNEKSKSFIAEFFKVIDDDPLLITDEYNSIDRPEYFTDHRHDQSIFSLLTKSFCKDVCILNDDGETYFYGWGGDDLNYPFLAMRKKTL